MTVQFISGFAKKENSTKVPVGETSMSLFGTLKMPCSIMEPVIQIERLANDASPQMYTYAAIMSWGRFYFVEDWVWLNGLWEVHLKEDVLASWKTEIGQQREYILRTDSTTDFNENITDTMYPSTTDIDTIVTENASPFSPASINSGTYVVGVISAGTNNSIGAITYYAMNSMLFGLFRTALFSPDALYHMGITDQFGQLAIADMSAEVFKTMYNPYQYVASCMWFPIDPDDIINKEALSAIKFGWWSFTASGWELSYPMMTITENAMSLPIHSQYMRGNYLNYAPYTERTLHGRYGTIPLDPAFFQENDSIQIRYNVDLITGKCRAIVDRLRNNAMDFVTEKEFLLGVPIQIAQVGIDYIGAAATSVSSGVSFFGSTMLQNYPGMLSSAAAGIASSLDARMPQLETSGANGSFLSSNISTKMVTKFYNIVDEDITHKGRPLCSDRRINELSGYVLCSEGDTDIACFDNERQAIAKYLTTGFFWE